ncbi:MULTISPECIES: DNA adenine methylase [Corynebacterium]|uniref:DNA adenine methylase n=1 Tax=Corynebacterium TaxID=1716 RepID=UPI00124D86DA|nr:MULTISPECIES: DNA adenine methylase [Corynebacterium]
MPNLAKPPFPYLGSKVSMARRIIELMPDHTHYVEPYAGSLGVLLAKPRSVAETAGDADHQLLNLWRTIRDHPAELAAAMRLTPHSRAEYYGALRDLPDTDDPVENARRTLTVLLQGTSRTTMHGGMWARYVKYTPSSRSLPSQLDAFADRIQPVADRLAGVSLDDRGAIGMIQKYGKSPTTLLYLDPPYPHVTRSGTAYPYDLNDDDHQELLDVITTVEAQVLISSYPNRMYDTALDGWDRFEFPSQAGGRGTRHAPRTEVVWRKPCS